MQARIREERRRRKKEEGGKGNKPELDWMRNSRRDKKEVRRVLFLEEERDQNTGLARMEVRSS